MIRSSTLIVDPTKKVSINRPRVKHAKTIKNAPHDDNDSDFNEDSESEEKLEAA